MYRDLKRYYHWAGMKREVAQWVSKCTTCQLVKAEHQVPSGLLQTMPMPEWKWDMVTMDFVTGLPPSRHRNDTIWVVVDRLTKSAHFLAIKKNDGVPRLAKIYLEEIVRLHGVPVSIVSDRDARFAAKFWREFQRALGTQVHMSTAYHPQTDGQSERTIQTIEDMLRACALEWRYHWEEHLPLVEFAYNNSHHVSIDMSPYEALYGRPCRTPLCWTEVGERREMGPEIVEETTKKISFLKSKMKEAQDRQKSYADKRRKDLEFQIGDWVFLKAVVYKGKDSREKRGKLASRYMGPYLITERIGAVAYKLDLPQELHAFHNVFHVSLLKKCVSDRDTVVSEPPERLRQNLTIDGRPLRIIGRRVEFTRRKQVKMVQVVWDCDGSEKTTWEIEAWMQAKFPAWCEEAMAEATNVASSSHN